MALSHDCNLCLEKVLLILRGCQKTLLFDLNTLDAVTIKKSTVDDNIIKQDLDAKRDTFDYEVCRDLKFEQTDFLEVNINENADEFLGDDNQKNIMDNPIETMISEKVTTDSTKYNCEICNKQIHINSRRRHMKNIHKIFAIKTPRKSLQSILLKSEKTQKKADCTSKDTKLNESGARKKNNSKKDCHVKPLIRNALCQCEICNKVLKKNSLKYHMGEVHRIFEQIKIYDSDEVSDDQYKCEHCGKILQKKSRNQHLKIVHGNLLKIEHIYVKESGIKIEHDDNDLTLLSKYTKAKDNQLNASNLLYNDTEYIKKNADESSFSCSMCTRTFSVKSRFENHVADHKVDEYLQNTNKNDGHLKCEICEEDFLSICALRIHIKFKHLKYKRVAKHTSCVCNVCGKVLTNQSRLKYHMVCHNGEKPFICDICKKSFVDKHFLAQHMNVHTTNKPFVCPVDGCNATFSSKGSRLVHFKTTHLKLKNFVCDKCGKGFRLACKLRDHYTVHSDIRTFHCEVCKKSYKTKKQLLKHIRTHSIVKAFACRLCNKRFTLPNYLRRHLKETKNCTYEKLKLLDQKEACQQ